MRKFSIPTFSLLFLGGVIFSFTSCNKNLEPGFTYTQDGLSVAFINTSEAEVDEYYWDFGDGNTSNERNPTHTYSNSGTYKVQSKLINGKQSQNAFYNITVEDNINPNGGLTVYIKRKGSDNPLNSNAGLVVIGRSKEGMDFNEYDSQKRENWQIQKPFVVSPRSLQEQEWFVDSAYTQKGQGKFPVTNQEAAPAIFHSLPPGTYYVHVLDEGMRKAVGYVEIEANQMNTVEFETQALGHLKVVIALSAIADSELDDIEFRLYGTEGDTLEYVLDHNKSDKFYEPYYSGISGTFPNEFGQEQVGTFYFMDIPASRKFTVIAYSDVYEIKTNERPHEEILIKPNFLTIVRVNFH